MKVIFQVDVCPPGGGGTTLRKIVDLPFVPVVGMEIEQSAWKDTRKVKAVTIGIDDNPYALAYMGLDELDSKDQAASWVEMYKAHGWKEPSFDD